MIMEGPDYYNYHATTIGMDFLEMHVSYLQGVHPHHIGSTLEKAVQTLTDLDIDFDTVVGTGLSGALLLPRLAEMLKCHYLIIRKEPTSHSYRPAEGMLGRRWLFVDDQRSTGATRNRVKDIVVRICERNDEFTSEYVGAYYYGWNSFEEP